MIPLGADDQPFVRRLILLLDRLLAGVDIPVAWSTRVGYRNVHRLLPLAEGLERVRGVADNRTELVVRLRDGDARVDLVMVP